MEDSKSSQALTGSILRDVAPKPSSRANHHQSSGRRMPTRIESARKKSAPNSHSTATLPSSIPQPRDGGGVSTYTLPGHPTLSVASAVKTNPLLVRPPPTFSHHDHSNGRSGDGDVVEVVELATRYEDAVTEDRPVFYGQRRNIRKTKEREMIWAITELAQYGDNTFGKKRTHSSFLDKVKSIGSQSPLRKKARAQTSTDTAAAPNTQSLRVTERKKRVIESDTPVEKRRERKGRAKGGPFILRPRPPLHSHNT